MENIIEKLVIIDFWYKDITSNKLSDPCHLTGKNGSTDYNKYIMNVQQKQITSSPFDFPNYPKYDSKLYFRKLNDKKLIKQSLI